MKTTHDLSELSWRLAGFEPHAWRFERTMEIGETQRAEIPAFPAPVPGSVQQALLEAGELDNWNLGLNARNCEWVENRHWIYETYLPQTWLPDNDTATVLLHCQGLDGNGVIRLNGEEIATFDNSFVPHVVDLTGHLASAGEGDRLLQIIFECPPRWLGQFGYTSRMTDWKPRFNYHWDWTSRLVQIGIWDAITLQVIDGAALDDLRVTTGADPVAGTGTLKMVGRVAGQGVALHCTLQPLGSDAVVAEQQVMVPAGTSTVTVTWQDLDVDLWWPNGMGEQPLYILTVELLDAGDNVQDRLERIVGFKHVVWRPCEGAPADADPWLCVVNGREVFLQGVNWTPIRPNFADVTTDQVQQRLTQYRDLHMNVLRVWGGAYLEREDFYTLCDELGILVWQEFPLSSSGVDNYAPDDPASIETLSEITRSYIRRRQHHVSLFIWSGGNELQNDKDGERRDGGGPLGLDHPLLARMDEIVREMDPSRRFVPTSASGPRFSANAEEFGQGLHWDVHGPWRAEGPLDEAWEPYWAGDDALLRSEVGAPGPSDAALIRRYAGDQAPLPASYANPLWRRTSWWIEWPQFIAEMGREPATLEAYVAWGQQRQAQALAVAARACKARFPRCGGFILWMGHDSFPCTANTAILDFEGNPKPAAFALAGVFKP